MKLDQAPPDLQTLLAAPNGFAVLLPRYARRPDLFVVEVFGAEPDVWQAKALEALARGELRISIRSGHGVGKTAFLAWVMLWFLLTRFPCKIVITAPSAPQLYDSAMAETKAWANRLPDSWRRLLDVQSDRISLRARPDEAFLSARTSRAETPDSLQGVHSVNVLLIVDEAAGVPESVYEAAQGSMSTPLAITILTGNPTRNSGTFWRTHTVDADRWFTLRVSCLDSKRVDPNYAKEIEAAYGRDSNRYRVRVEGHFPLAEGDTLIPAALVEEAMMRPPVIDPGAALIYGVDVARFGSDQSCLVKRKGFVMLEPPRRFSQIDTMALTGIVAAEYARDGEGGNQPAAIVVDTIGIGAGVADRLRELGLPVVDVNVAESASTSTRFVRLRDELWDSLRVWFESRTASIPYDDRLRDELVTPKVFWSSDGRFKAETKDQLRARGMSSPDSADSLALTLAPGAMLAVAYGAMRYRQPIRRNIRGIV